MTHFSLTENEISPANCDLLLCFHLRPATGSRCHRGAEQQPEKKVSRLIHHQPAQTEREHCVQTQSQDAVLQVISLHNNNNQTLHCIKFSSSNSLQQVKKHLCDIKVCFCSFRKIYILKCGKSNEPMLSYRTLKV